MKTILTILTLLYAISNFSQIGFEEEILRLEEEIAFSENKNSLKRYMKKQNIDFSESYKNSAGNSTFYQFASEYHPTMTVMYKDKTDELVLIVGLYSPQTMYACESELEENGFKIESTEMVKNEYDIDVEVNTLSKKGYPYKFVVNHKYYLVYLVTSISDMY
jgi:hypothetical protein